MKYLIFITLFVLSLSKQTFSQLSFSFAPTTPPDISLATNYSGCAGATTLNSLGSITVANVPSPLNITTNRLAKIELNLNAACGDNLRDLNLILKHMPSGKCFVFYDGSSIPTTTAPPVMSTFNLIDNPSCGVDLVVPYISTTYQNLSKSTSSNVGASKAGCHTCASSATFNNQPLQANGGTLTATFNGIDPNGEWRIYSFFNGAAGDAPCLQSVSMSFGDPTAADRRPDGETCATAIEWTGAPFCATTSNRAGSSQMPGSLCGPNTQFADPVTIGGRVCEWNFANNNDIWIKYTAAAGGYVCLSLSGVRTNQQSIVVTDSNIDGDNLPCIQSQSKKTYDCSCVPSFLNPCSSNDTKKNDPYWQVVSCPRDNNQIYGLTTGADLIGQQHCFTAEQGKTYFLVVDGDGGSEATIYISGLRGTSNSTLSENLLQFKGETIAQGNRINWRYFMDDYDVLRYELQRSSNGRTFYKLENWDNNKQNSFSKEFVYVDKQALPTNNFYRLKISHKDGNEFYSQVVRLSGNKNIIASVFPNPVINTLTISAPSKIDHVNVFNSKGQVVYTDTRSGFEILTISTSNWSKGQYIVVVTDLKGNTETIKVVK